MWKRQLEHPGVQFHGSTSPGVTLECGDDTVTLTDDAGEVAQKWAAYRHGRGQVEKKVRDRFLQDFARLYNVKLKNRDHVCMLTVPPAATDKSQKKDKNVKRSKSPDVKHVIKKKVEKKAEKKVEKKVPMALVDGKPVPMGRAWVDPPGIFRGRGKENDLTGRIRRRIYPEDVTLNLSRGAPVPPVPMEGHTWGSIVHDRGARWLAKWIDPVTSRMKYVYLADTAEASHSDVRKKFDLIQEMLPSFDAMREKNLKYCSSRRAEIRQAATCAAIIFDLALRIGSSSSHRTFGAATFLCKHVTLVDKHLIRLEFLGKDSVPYLEEAWHAPSVVFENVKQMTSGKGPGDRVFDLVQPAQVNAYLQKIHVNLTARVLRTLCANRCFVSGLEFQGDHDCSGDACIDHYKRALLDVARLCNHQKASTDQEHPSYVTRTALANYLDPRTTFRYAREHKITDLTKLLPKGLLGRFQWAAAAS